MKLCTVFVRHLLEYASQVWHPRDIGPCAQFEKVQRLHAQFILGRQRPSNDEKLCFLVVPSLSLMRQLLDLTFVHRILHGHMKITLSDIGIALLT